MGRPYFLTLNIVVVKHHLFISTIPLNPPLKRGTWCCCRYLRTYYEIRIVASIIFRINFLLI